RCQGQARLSRRDRRQRARCFGGEAAVPQAGRRWRGERQGDSGGRDQGDRLRDQVPQGIGGWRLAVHARPPPTEIPTMRLNARRQPIRLGLAILLGSALAVPLGTASAGAGTRTIVLVRHGQYREGVPADPEIGPGLTELGREQGRKTAARIAGPTTGLGPTLWLNLSIAHASLTTVQVKSGGMQLISLATPGICRPISSPSRIPRAPTRAPRRNDARRSPSPRISRFEQEVLEI